ncbi:hypothetical protein M2105_004365 [Paenibacillus sp. PastF-1]|nr:hypothetical protein [Paenibacillus sp. PastF-2]MDF9849785.1 hypothetical protein [Paenibacillus sp. PastM-2]MDF9856492.1 hypothetical protein [Paenibacillus sp. PastF-1]MDH6481762.1 hypothetical protein [Paenibacillus sp. PastH-2]MDH6509148.1 hypothetical protein [Paenibacillus sp. PastM-3]
MFSRESAVLRADCSGLTGRSSPRSWAEATSSCVGLCRLPDVIPDPHSSSMCGTEIVLYSLPLRMCVRHRIRVVSRASSRPFGGGGTLLLLCGDPPKSPFRRGTPRAGRPLDTRNKGSEFGVYGGGREGLLRRGERPFLGSPDGGACGAFT